MQRTGGLMLVRKSVDFRYVFVDVDVARIRVLSSLGVQMPLIGLEELLIQRRIGWRVLTLVTLVYTRL